MRFLYLQKEWDLSNGVHLVALACFYSRNYRSPECTSQILALDTAFQVFHAHLEVEGEWRGIQLVAIYTSQLDATKSYTLEV